jgi:hypothetical protein
MERISRAKNRMRQSRSSGTVGGEGGNLLAYPANLIKRKRCERPRPPRGYDRVLKRVGIQY